MGASNHPGLALRKPDSPKKIKARKDRQWLNARALCRRLVYERRLVLNAADAATVFEIANIHEVVPRSLGGSATDPLNCRCLCHACHRKAHGQ